MTHFFSFKKAFSCALLGCCALCITPAVMAQDNTAAKKELATRIVNLQKAQDMDALIAQLAGSANKAVVAEWLPKLDKLPQAKQKLAADLLDNELKKFNEDNIRTIRNKNEKISLEVLVPAYVEKFSAEELRQLVVFLESPVIKKYYAANPQLANQLAQSLVDATRSDVNARIKAFDAKAAQILGTSTRRN